METKTIELGGQLYEIRLIEQHPQPQLEPTLPTLHEVFNKVMPIYVLDELNCILKCRFSYDTNVCHSQLSTERQCKRIQALIALQNIADYYNGEVDYRGEGWVVENSQVYLINSYMSSPTFKFRYDAESAIEILRNAQLLENL